MKSNFGCLWDQVKGHEKQKEVLLQSMKDKRLAHCNLFVGEEGIGKRLLAIACAQYLVCEKDQGKACGFCPPCIRMAKEQSESLLEIRGENGNIKLESAEEIAHFLRLSQVTKARAIVIDGVDSMNPQTANALLKTLEEPPKDSFFFLISNKPDKLLQTIRSRSQTMRFKPLLKGELKAFQSSAKDWQVSASLGSVSRLKAWVEEEKVVLREDFLLLMKNLKGSSYQELLSKLTFCTDSKQSFLETCELLLLFLRDCLALLEGEEQVLFFPDQLDILKTYSSLGPEVIQHWINLCNTMERDLELNLDKNMLWQCLCFQMQRDVERL